MTVTDIATTRHPRRGHRLPPALARQLTAERRAAQQAHAAGDDTEAWRLLERTHVLGQPWPWPHVRSHLDMLRLAVRTRNRREAIGQLLRIIVAGPGSATGRYPLGNTGRADVPATKPMPVPADLAELLAAH
jgi:hypothetical protein